MPTGYTADVQSGKIVEFKDYAKCCARAFGAFVSLRDQPSNIELPRHIDSENDYHHKSLQEAEQRLSALTSMSSSELLVASIDDYREEILSHTQHVEKIKQELNRYESMLNKVHAYVPPTSDHVAFKNFMVQQLESSIQFDCDLEYYEKNVPKLLSPEAWKAEQLKSAQWNKDYHSKELEKDLKSDSSRNQWIEEFFKSIGE